MSQADEGQRVPETTQPLSKDPAHDLDTDSGRASP